MNKIVIANWKNHPATIDEAKALFTGELELAEQYAGKVKTIICPPAKFLPDLTSELKTINYKLETILGAQDVFWQVIATTLGVGHVLVGHSDQRAAGDTDEIVNHKLKIALASDVVPIFLVGEQTKDTDRQAVLEAQLDVGLAGLSPEDMDKVLICYEPVWAVSTNPAAEADTPADTLRASDLINEFLSAKFRVAHPTILYGGSVNAKNVADFLKHPEVSGAVIGAASLDAEEFSEILKAAATL